ncbi:uncharacterized protein V6R79_000924 [Siganus canaliculatus]
MVTEAALERHHGIVIPFLLSVQTLLHDSSSWNVTRSQLRWFREQIGEYLRLRYLELEGPKDQQQQETNAVTCCAEKQAAAAAEPYKIRSVLVLVSSLTAGFGDVIGESATGVGIRRHRVRSVCYQLHVLYCHEKPRRKHPDREARNQPESLFLRQKKTNQSSAGGGADESDGLSTCLTERSAGGAVMDMWTDKSSSSGVRYSGSCERALRWAPPPPSLQHHRPWLKN